mmetsp:Transcript_44212/g.105284  ORF Transcript_44212/g.105284 Transcript_44212/m.105284 type:complete len:224 (+) Transcript_44212:219-890(+)
MTPEVGLLVLRRACRSRAGLFVPRRAYPKPATRCALRGGDYGSKSTLSVDKLPTSAGRRLRGLPFSQSSPSETNPPIPENPSGRDSSWLCERVRVRSFLSFPSIEGSSSSSLLCSHNSSRAVSWQMLIGRDLRLLWSRFSSSSDTHRPSDGGSDASALWSSQSCLIAGRFPIVGGSSFSLLLETASCVSARKLPIFAGSVSSELSETVSTSREVRSSMSGGSS